MSVSWFAMEDEIFRPSVLDFRLLSVSLMRFILLAKSPVFMLFTAFLICEIPAATLERAVVEPLMDDFSAASFLASCSTPADAAALSFTI